MCWGMHGGGEKMHLPGRGDRDVWWHSGKREKLRVNIRKPVGTIARAHARDCYSFNWSCGTAGGEKWMDYKGPGKW